MKPHTLRLLADHIRQTTRSKTVVAFPLSLTKWICLSTLDPSDQIRQRISDKYQGREGETNHACAQNKKLTFNKSLTTTTTSIETTAYPAPSDGDGLILSFELCHPGDYYIHFQ